MIIKNYLMQRQDSGQERCRPTT